MAKYEERITARALRQNGESVKSIAQKLHISKSTASLWVRDIVLSTDQLEKIRGKWLKATEKGRLLGSLSQKKRRLALIEKYKNYGIKKLANISKKEKFASGIALYWSEGSKKTRKVQFCNSDPKLILFLINWLETFFGIESQRLALRLEVNETHKKREDIIKSFWSRELNIPISQFRKTSFKKTKSAKIYENYDQYFGTLEVSVLKPGELYYKILGLIDGLAGVAQR